MVGANTKAMGIIFPNSFDALVSDMVNFRLMASLPFASRYRMVDFVLSSMTNCGVDNVVILPNRNYHSLMDHLGTGREWDLARKDGGVRIFPPYAENGSKLSSGRVGSLANIMRLLKEQTEKYVIMSDSNIAVNFDFNEMIDAHIKSGADVTIAYKEESLPEAFLESEEVNKDYYYSFDIDNGRVTEIHVNPTVGVHNLSMNIFVIERELLIKLAKEAFDHGLMHFTRDVLWAQRNTLNIQAYEFKGYAARILSINSYFEENMKLLEEENLDGLFAPSPIYTKVRDDNPTRYISGAKAENVMIADGCVIEGEVENSVLFRGVKVAKGAVVKDSIIMQDNYIGENTTLNCVITDKNVVIGDRKHLSGCTTLPYFIQKGTRI